MKLADLKDLPKPITESSNENATLSKTPPPGDVAPDVTTAQAAKMLGVTQSRVRQFIMQGRLKSKKPVKGRRDNLIPGDSVRKFAKKDRKITGRPDGTTKK
ncbi:MAG: hypothetical protein JWP44_5019 [Mucilaginibacter sp.]|nr:hypothetical protein [Mucilaginibacter sp.]